MEETVSCTLGILVTALVEPDKLFTVEGTAYCTLVILITALVEPEMNYLLWKRQYPVH